MWTGSLVPDFFSLNAKFKKTFPRKRLGDRRGDILVTLVLGQGRKGPRAEGGRREERPRRGGEGRGEGGGWDTTTC